MPTPRLLNRSLVRRCTYRDDIRADAQIRMDQTAPFNKFDFDFSIARIVRGSLPAPGLDEYQVGSGHEHTHSRAAYRIDPWVIGSGEYQ